MSAETGVGPSIASGSHECSGTCADFAAQPTNSIAHARYKRLGENLCAAAPANASAYEIDPTTETIMKIANKIPTSPTTFMTNALVAAATADGRSYQNPIKKNDARPTSPQPISKPTKLSESTSVSIAKTKKFM